MAGILRRDVFRSRRRLDVASDDNRSRLRCRNRRRSIHRDLADVESADDAVDSLRVDVAGLKDHSRFDADRIGCDHWCSRGAGHRWRRSHTPCRRRCRDHRNVRRHELHDRARSRQHVVGDQRYDDEHRENGRVDEKRKWQRVPLAVGACARRHHVLKHDSGHVTLLWRGLFSVTEELDTAVRGWVHIAPRCGNRVNASPVSPC